MIAEKKLTPAEIKKREEIARAIERDNPNMPMSKKMAIATAQAKKVAESMMREKKRLLLTDEDLEEGSPSFNYAVALATVEEPEKNFVKIGGKNIRKTMDMQTARRIVKDYESQQDEAKQDFNFKAKITDEGDTFEIGGDVFVRESVKPKHRYAYIVENTLNLRESYQTLNLKDVPNFFSNGIAVDKNGNVSIKPGLTHYKGFPGWPQGTWGQNFESMGFENPEIGRNMPILVNSNIVDKINNLKSSARTNRFALVMGVAADTKTMSNNFKKGNGLIFKYTGGDFKNDATDFTITLLENGFFKVKWCPGWLGGAGAIVAEYVGSGGTMYLGTTSSSRTEGPVWNLHKRVFKTGFGTAKHKMFYFEDVAYVDQGSTSFYGVEAESKPAKSVSNLGVFATRLPQSKYKYDIYGDDVSSDVYSDSARLIGDMAALSTKDSKTISAHGLLDRNLGRDDIPVRKIFNTFEISGSEEVQAVAPAPSISRDERREQRPTFTPVGAPAETVVTSQSSESEYEKRQREQEEILKSKKISEILDLALSNDIDIKTITPYDLNEFSLIDLDSIEADVRKRIEAKKEAAVGATGGVITALLGSWLRTLQGKFQEKVSIKSQEALERALKILKDSLDPTSDIGKKIYTTQTMTVAAMLAAGVGGFFLLRRFLRDRRQRQLAKHMYGDFGARRELQQIARRSGLDKVPHRELMLMLPNLENYELSSPQVRRLYDL